MSDFDREKLGNLLDESGMDEEYFVKNLKSMIDKGGLNLSKGMQMLGELRGLGKKNVTVGNINPLLAFGQERLANRVQDNRRIEEVTSFEIIEDN
jgi:hypothetical protein